MPAKNTVKLYVPNGYYHVYNRGVEKRNIFLDDSDYQRFLYFLKYYLGTPKKNDIKQKNRSLHTKVTLLAFCLMPNHFHLLLKQSAKDGMTKLTRAVNTSYVGYFNLRYNRVGGLFQGKYKAVLVEKDRYLLHLSRYIHLNPMELERVGPWLRSNPLHSYPYSSYSYYLGLKSATWVKPDEIISYFQTKGKPILQGISSYKQFTEQYEDDPKESIGNLALE